MHRHARPAKQQHRRRAAAHGKRPSECQPLCGGHCEGGRRKESRRGASYPRFRGTVASCISTQQTLVVSARHARFIARFEPGCTSHTSEAISDIVRGSARRDTTAGHRNATVPWRMLQASESTQAAARQRAPTCVGEEAEVDAEVVVRMDVLLPEVRLHRLDHPCARTSVAKEPKRSRKEASMDGLEAWATPKTASSSKP